MSTNLNYKQVANVERRTWDLEAYEKRAKERVKSDDNGDKKKRKSTESSLSSLGPQDDGEEQKEEFQRAARGAAGPAKSERAFLKARRNRVDLDSKIGSIEMINPEAVATTKSHVGEPGSIKVCLCSSTTVFLCQDGVWLTVSDLFSGRHHKDGGRLALQSLRLFLA